MHFLQEMDKAYAFFLGCTNFRVLLKKIFPVGLISQNTKK